MYKSRHDKETVIGLVIAGILLITFTVITIKLSQIRKTERVVIDDRYWVYTLSVRYTTRDCDMVMDSDGNMSIECDTYVHTRCRNQLSGRELPPARPLPACEQRADDYLHGEINYYILYHLEDETEKKGRWFTPAYWNDLQPHRTVELTTNIFGAVVGVKGGG